ncbi:hypothetical protein JAAARDRAFT_692009 [Jaapia argillacea MUCL 33604]|uniref:Plasma membrane fusion protein PRM1 n=1 Tax=Jaapia argillacea MUCL 33604 TaxID=933084 RepID=A0A067PX64_9AGAM|nr:hypothetical protein JAAARDRAFT_692009 [Jaapia argillacea MUCL 33604]
MSVTSHNPRSDTPPPVYDSRRIASPSRSTLKPYLQLPHLLSLTWLAYPILSLLFIAFRLSLSSESAQDAVANARGDLLTSCKAAEQAATSAASMPRYLAAATNKQITDAVNDTMNGARAGLILSLTIMETVINFLIDIYRSTFFCFLELIIQGGLAILIAAVQDISNAVTATLNGIRTNIQNDVAAANSVIQGAVSAINKVNPFGNINVPQFSIPSLDALQNVTIPNDFESALVQLNASLPTFNDLKQKLEAIIDTPFEAVKADINQTFTGLSFNVSFLPVPAQNTLTFCDGLDTSVVDDLGRDLVKATTIGIVIIVALALLLLAGNCFLEWYKWRCLQNHLENTRRAWITDPTLYHSSTSVTPTVQLSDHNLMLLQASLAHPLLTRISNALQRLLRLTPSQHTNLQWFFHYVFHPPALACFLIGFFGLLSVELQLLAIGPLEAKYQAQAAASITDFSNTIATSINNSMFNQSAAYANTINGHIDTVQSSINDGLFGWVNITTSTLNDTLVTFYDDIQNGVATVFNGTILNDPIQTFIKCFLGSKVDALEEALTFLQQNLNINVPRVNESVLVLSPADVNEAVEPISAAAIGGGTTDKEGLVGRLINTYVASLKKERIMFGVFLGIWGVVVLMALGVVFWHSYGRGLLEAYRRRRWRKASRDGIAVDPFQSGFRGASDGEKGGMGEKVDIPNFTPMTSPGFNPLLLSQAPPIVFDDPSGHRRKESRGNHPLNSLRPQFEKSWDSFFDHGSRSEAGLAPAVQKESPKKLTGIGRKAMGKEILVPDEENATVVPDVPQSEGRPPAFWMKRMTGMFWRKPQVDRVDTSSETGSIRERSRANLTISTERASPRSQDGLPAVEATSADLGPTSAWSISPNPPRRPWVNSLLPAKKSVPSVPPLRLNSRRKASVPLDVESMYDSSTVILPSTQNTEPAPPPFPIPLHHGFVDRGVSGELLPHPAQPWAYHSVISPPASQSLAPPYDRHKRNPSVPAVSTKHKRDPSQSQGGPPESTVPVTRLLTTTHTRHTSLAVDPFATPFDDDQAPLTNPSTPSGKRRTNDPFAAVAY